MTVFPTFFRAPHAETAKYKFSQDCFMNIAFV